jgi:(2S)-methylsuccinyl-CoA dehydrogenase
MAQVVLDGAAANLGRLGPDGVDDHQVVAYDLAHAAAALAAGRVALDYGAHGAVETALAEAFVAEAVWDLMTKVLGREDQWGTAPGCLEGAREFVGERRDPAWLAGLAATPGPRHLSDDLELVADTFRRFAEDRIGPVAQHLHRTNADIPEDIIAGLAGLGAFGLSIPDAYGGYATGDDGDSLAMVVATEELSRVSLGAGGSLITRPEIMARALLHGGTEEQKRTWLPRLASGELMVAVAVTEPDYGSDVASLTVSATPAGSSADSDWLIRGTKTWSTFAARADVLLVLARTDPDRAAGHRGLSLFIVPKSPADGRGFVLTQPGGGRLEGRPIDTIGYRGMHSYELAFDRWAVPSANLVGGPGGTGRGFYLQMAGFESGRLQTAARAVGLMQAAYESAATYAAARRVFGRPIDQYQLTRAKLARMLVVISATRQHAYDVSRRLATETGTVEASMVKAYACRAAEWVAREAMQIHGGMGYAEEDDVSRLYLDARVLSIFEGTDETLALKVIARRLVEQAVA